MLCELIGQEISLRDSNRELLYGFYVAGVPSITMKNISSAKGITNGIQYHSIMLLVQRKKKRLFEHSDHEEGYSLCSLTAGKKVDRDSDRDDKKAIS